VEVEVGEGERFEREVVVNVMFRIPLTLQVLYDSFVVYQTSCNGRKSCFEMKELEDGELAD